MPEGRYYYHVLSGGEAWGQGQAGMTLPKLCHSHLLQPGDQGHRSKAAFGIQEGHFLGQQSCSGYSG